MPVERPPAPQSARRWSDLDPTASTPPFLAQDDAKRLLKIKRLKQNALQTAYAGLERLETLTLQLEEATTREDLVHGLEQGTAALERLNSQLPIARVEALVERTDSAVIYQQQVDDAILGSGLFGDADEADVDAALAELEGETTLAAPPVPGASAAAAAAAPASARPAAVAASGAGAAAAAALPVAPVHDVRGPTAVAAAAAAAPARREAVPG